MEVVIIIVVGIGVSLTVASGIWVAVALVRAVFVRNNASSHKTATNDIMPEERRKSRDAGHA
ncbi:MAG: hypothetical protein ACYST6_16555 [Planctomycetota bacterium]